MNYIWKRLSTADVERLVVQYKLTSVERAILELRRQGYTLSYIGDKIGYDERHIRRLTAKLLDKIRNELY